MDVETILSQQLAAVDLLRAVQWISQFLWFLPSDSSAAKLTPCSPVLQKLAQLHASSMIPSRMGSEADSDGALDLQPLEASDTGLPGAFRRFSTLQICIRSVLEALAERLGGLPEAVDQQQPVIEWEDAGSKTQLHPRLLQLCCPLLDQARIALEASALLTFFRLCVHFKS